MEALKADGVDDRIGSAATTIYQALIEAEPGSVIDAVPRERTETRTGLRNGHRPKTILTVAGDLELQIPKLRARSSTAVVTCARAARRAEQLHSLGVRPGQQLVRRRRVDHAVSVADRGLTPWLEVIADCAFGNVDGVADGAPSL